MINLLSISFPYFQNTSPNIAHHFILQSGLNNQTVDLSRIFTVNAHTHT